MLAAFWCTYFTRLFQRENCRQHAHGIALIHARFMVATAFPMFTPITDRILFIYFPSLVSYLPLIEGQPNAPVAGFLLADVMLVGPSVWDWVSHKRWNVFPFALVVLLAYHWSFLYGYQFAAWQRFCAWLVAL